MRSGLIQINNSSPATCPALQSRSPFRTSPAHLGDPVAVFLVQDRKILAGRHSTHSARLRRPAPQLHHCPGRIAIEDARLAAACNKSAAEWRHPTRSKQQQTGRYELIACGLPHALAVRTPCKFQGKPTPQPARSPPPTFQHRQALRRPQLAGGSETAAKLKGMAHNIIER